MVKMQVTADDEYINFIIPPEGIAGRLATKWKWTGDEQETRNPSAGGMPGAIAQPKDLRVHFMENISAAKDSKQRIAMADCGSTVARNITADVRSIQHIGPQALEKDT